MSRFHDLDASIARALDETAPPPEVTTTDAPPTPDTPTGEPDPERQTEEETDMADDTPLAEREDYKAGVAAGQTAANERMNAVFASEHFAGREASAAKFLGRASMSAEDITSVLAEMPAATAALTPEQQQAAAEAGGRAEMREAMEAAGNKNLGGDQQKNDGKTGRAASDAVWDKANAATGRVKKEG